MKVNQKTIQIILVFFGFFLILGTYFFYPKIIKEKKLTELNKEKPAENTVTIDGNEANVFENVEYQGIYNLNNTFTIKSKEAHILNDEPDMVYMENMQATIYMKDGRVIKITSENGKYNKINYDCFFEKNVKATDLETTILSDNLDLLSTEDYATVYNNVILTSENGSLKADKINYDFTTEMYEISMFDDNAVKIKILK